MLMCEKKVFGPSVDVFPTLREGIDLRGAQETPRAAREPLFSGRNQQQTRVVVQQIFGGNSATTARFLLLCSSSKAKEAAVQQVLRAAWRPSYKLGVGRKRR